MKKLFKVFLLISVNPSDCRTDFSDTELTFCLGEFGGFIDFKDFDYLVIQDDFNANLSSSSAGTSMSDFMHEKGLVCTDKLLSSVTQTD